LLAATVNDADADTNLVQQSKFFGERREIFAVFRDFAGESDDKRLPS
jgi:hypothetical protein